MSHPPSNTHAPRFDSPQRAMEAMLDRLSAVEAETVDLAQATGRVLAEPLIADRDSPPCDVSAMDGYAVRLTDLSIQPLLVSGEACVGKAPPPLPAGSAMRLMTGGPLPPGAEAVIRREDVDEHPQRIVLRVGPEAIQTGQNIRRRGENLAAGASVVPAGVWIQGSQVAALAAFGVARPRVFRRLRVGVLTTGDELLPVESSPRPWQIRNSNGPALASLLAGALWIGPVELRHASDRPEAIQSQLNDLLSRCDVVLLTGGVSMGDHDHVPQCARAAGGEILFHKLPLRPGKPILGAIGPQGQAILGLPGNPVSVLVGAVRLAGPILRKRAGFAVPAQAVASIQLTEENTKTLNLWWYRLVACTQPGQARLVPGQGSGDFVSAARSDGFIEIPPGRSGNGPWPFYRWEL